MLRKPHEANFRRRGPVIALQQSIRVHFQRGEKILQQPPLKIVPADRHAKHLRASAASPAATFPAPPARCSLYFS